MTDRDLGALEEILAVRGGFGHSEHLELAWTLLASHPIDRARRLMASSIRHVAELHGAPDRYHETITQTWVHLVAVHMSASSASSFDQFISESPGLLDRHLLDRHYGSDVLWSDAARARWTEPDLLGLPALGS
jgi:hypothetical protein